MKPARKQVQAIVRTIHDAEALTEVIALARHLGVDPVSLVIGLIAQAEAPKNRTAARIAKAILCNARDEELTTVTQILRLH
jgi:predicted dinucleotide-binding enzyme